MEISSFPFPVIPTTTTSEFDLIQSPFPFPFPPPPSSSSSGAFPVSQSFYPALEDMEGLGEGDGGGIRFSRRMMTGDDDGDGEDRKRVYFGEGGGGGGSELKEILTSLAFLEEEERQDREEYVLDFDRERSEMEANRRRGMLEMGSYREALDGHYEAVSEMEEAKVKRVRRSAGAAAAAAVVVAEDSAGSSGTTTGTAARRLWVKDRSKDWWERLSSPDYPEEEFKRELRMSRATFEMICEELDSSITKKNTMLRDAIPVRQRVAVCIWRLATGEPLRLVSKRFGLGISTCHKLVLEVCSAIKNVLMPKFLQWPEEGRMAEIKGQFESVSGIKNIGGAMYTTHVLIIAPKIRVAEYYNKRHTERNQKTSYSITVQGVVDERGVFTDICIGWPGSMSDENVLEKSALFQRAGRGLLQDVWIVGGAGYPLMDWILVPYTQRNLTWSQHAFNEKVNAVRGVAREAFARLKGRWACLQKRTEVKLQDLPVVLGACCILHNICEMRGETVEPGTRFDIFDDELVAENGVRSAAAMQERDRIAHNLLHYGLAGTSFL
ncbi:hypothetical protein MLD38_014270 [Melastoma candidum]|uniref:Uncharacterized protein n=1 Tax=Melastoma candidum TaxID=119954 RepID=A0ACB9RFY5_9MYRT|nr:hypothetical protein MLD38_014270 [Melastoma candidum]